MKKTYCNPVPFLDGKFHTNPDPFVLRWCGMYYCYATDEFGVKVSRSYDLVEWEYLGYAIEEREFHHYWAPSVLYENGTFYMYYSNIPVEEKDCHQENLKLAVSDSPEGPFVWKKTFFQKFSIDSHPFLWNGEQYMFYSVNDWIGAEDEKPGTCILLDRMVTPEEFEGKPRAVILPSLSQEIYMKNRFGDGRDWYTIEGACTLVHNDKIWLMYSANAYENVDYFVGTAVAEAVPDVEDLQWRKYPDPYTWQPLLRKNELVEGTGHNTVTKAPNMVDDWIVYHGRNTSEPRLQGVEQRSMRIDRLFNNGYELKCAGPTMQETDCPKAPQIKQTDIRINGEYFLGEAFPFYCMECWLKAEPCHTGARYGIYLNYENTENYLELIVHSGRKELQVWDCQNGIAVMKGRQSLKKELDETVPHCFRIQRNDNEFEIKMDENVPINISYRGKEQSGKIGVKSYYTTGLTLCSAAVTWHASLVKENLQKLGWFYRVPEKGSRLIYDDGLLFGKRMVLEGIQRHPEFMEEFEFEKAGSDMEVTGLQEKKEVFAYCNDTKRLFSLYHYVSKGEEWFLVDGRKFPVQMEKKERVSLVLKDVKIKNYYCTKI